MKVAAIVVALCADVVFSASIDKRQAGGIGAILGKAQNKGYGKVLAPAGGLALKQVTESPIKVEGSTVKRVKILAGPYKVPGMGVSSGGGHQGMLESYFDGPIDKPCAGDCTILRQVGGLEYLNGTDANIDTGMWLHHMVHFNKGPGRWDPVGYGVPGCMPFLGVSGGSAKTTERYFVTGNERTVFNYYAPETGVKSGYALRTADVFTYLVELMNMNMDAQTVYLTMTYDVIEGKLPTGFLTTKTIYLDVASCGTSEYMPKANQQNNAFQISSKPWKPNVEGKIVFGLGHLHDGGVAIDIKASPSEVLCKSNAAYSENPKYVFTGTTMGKDKVAKDHISSMHDCVPQDFKIKEMKKSQAWTTTGFYDFAKRTGDLEKGKQSEVMAISIVLVAGPPDVKPV